MKTISITDDLHTRLKTSGTMGDTFDSVITRLLNFYEEQQKTNNHIQKQRTL